MEVGQMAQPISTKLDDLSLMTRIHMPKQSPDSWKLTYDCYLFIMAYVDPLHKK